ncbi:hypothetical protein HYQ46_002887 [Verticillium longisporum]|nr:hypothetical protein HYQ46_002887 [Verticillium longisporum]
MSIGVGLVGGGIWAREEHAPAIEAAKDLTLKAVFSRTLKSAQSIADVVAGSPELYSDEGDAGFDALLERSDVDAIIVSLPIANQPPYIRKALLAGKHVLSEKPVAENPVAENVKDAVELIKWYRSEIKGPSWTIGENWRFLKSYEFAADELNKGSLGKIIGFHGRQHGCVPLDWKFNLTEWRRKPTHQGGYLLDGGVHYMAGLRLLLASQSSDQVARLSSFTSQIKEYLPPHGCVPLNWKFNLTKWRRNPTHQGGYLLDGGVHHMAGLRLLLASQSSDQVARLSSFTSQIKEYLPPVDTADVIIKTKAGVTGTFQISRGTSLSADEWTVACENGWIKIENEKVTISRDGTETVETVANERSGVPPEIRAWGEALVAGKVRPEQEPEAALADLELIELMLRSGESNGAPVDTQHQDV